MNYKYYKTTEYLEGEQLNCYYEVDEIYRCRRVVYSTNKEYVSTNFIYDDYKFTLPDQSLEEVINKFEKLTKLEFEKLWYNSISKYLDSWNEMKNTLETDKLIRGEIVCFYPQGVIVDIGLKFYGLANYNECLEVVGEKRMYPKNRIIFKFIQFDDKNMWIHLKPIKG